MTLNFAKYMNFSKHISVRLVIGINPDVIGYNWQNLLLVHACITNVGLVITHLICN